VCNWAPPASKITFAAVLLGPPLGLSHFISSTPSVSVFVQNLVLYLLALGTSITLYRLSPFHPLAKYPGPVLARVSRLWATRNTIQGHQHLISNALFERYGNVVRTGPDHLIIRDASAVPVVLGTKAGWSRGPRASLPCPHFSTRPHRIYRTGYNVFLPYGHAGGILDVRDPTAHATRRRIWDRAFTPAALKSYRPLLEARVEQLITQLAARTETPIDIMQWFSFVTIDFMGDFAYGGLFNTTTRGRDDAGVHEFGLVATRFVDILGTLPWMRPIALSLPTTSVQTFLDTARDVVEARMRNGSQFRDLFYYLVRKPAYLFSSTVTDAT
jgi:hypothetical protein